MLSRRPKFTILFVLIYLVRVPSKVKAQNDTQGTANGTNVEVRTAVASSGAHGGSSGGHSAGSPGGHSPGAPSEDHGAPETPAGNGNEAPEPVPAGGSGPKPPRVAGPRRDLPEPPPRPKNNTKGAALLVVGQTVLALGGAALQQEREADSWKYLNGLPLPTINPDDPPDEDINQPFWYHGRRIYEHNRCALFQENLKSRPNGRRKKMCSHASDHLREKIQDEPPENRSTRCPDVGGGRCFAVDGRLGRCYVVVESHSEDKHYELINKC